MRHVKARAASALRDASTARRSSRCRRRRTSTRDWKQVKVNIDYHVSFEEHFYSVPYTLIGETCGAALTSHRGTAAQGQARREPSAELRQVRLQHDPGASPRFAPGAPGVDALAPIHWGRTIGPHTAALVEHVIRSKPHPEQGYRSALGILRLADKHGTQRLERACEKAFHIHSPSYKTVKTMLQQRMEAAPLRDAEPAAASDHLGAVNVRGPGYYH